MSEQPRIRDVDVARRDLIEALRKAGILKADATHMVNMMDPAALVAFWHHHILLRRVKEAEVPLSIDAEDLDSDSIEAARQYCKTHVDFLPGHHLVVAIVEGFLLAKAEQGVALCEVEDVDEAHQ